MAITVYWASLEREWMLAKEPESVAKLFYEKDMHDTDNLNAQLNYCPSFNKNLKNVYALRSIYDYSFKIDGDKVWSPDRDQEFFDMHVNIRDIKRRLFSFKQCFLFFTEEDSLPVTFYEYPYLEDNNITERCMIVAGQFDIGKWFRNTEFAFYLKKDYNEFKIQQDEVFTYLRFHTDGKINFKQFRPTQRISELIADGFACNQIWQPLRKLENYYRIFKNKKLALREIKENLL